MTLHPLPLNFLIYEENFLFFFISVGNRLETLEDRSLCGAVLYINILKFFLDYLSCEETKFTEDVNSENLYFFINVLRV
jgi:hypothetical protein